MTARQEESRAIATLARSIQFESDERARQARIDAAEILDAAAQVMFEDGVSVAQVVERIHGK